jgi:cytochrome d ubiquinol oxidase subunit II
MALEPFFALVMLAALVAYALLGCADFGGGIWDLFSVGPRAREQRRHIAQAIGPVWEANHVWLIFLIVVLFTCFPRAYAAASTALFWPLHLILAGIVLRGAAFVFRAYHAVSAAAELGWSRLFGAASALTPVLLGACLGAISTGDVAVVDGMPAEGSSSVWLGRFSVATGLLAFLLSAYLAAVYLAWESDGELQEDFRRRALATWLLAGLVSFGLLILTAMDAPHLWKNLTGGSPAAIVAAGALLAPASAAALWKRRFTLARVLAGGQVALLLIGWAAAQYPYLIAPDLTFANSAAPRETLALTAMTLPLGVALLAPSLWYLFAVFKGKNPEYAVRSRDSR